MPRRAKTKQKAHREDPMQRAQADLQKLGLKLGLGAGAGSPGEPSCGGPAGSAGGALAPRAAPRGGSTTVRLHASFPEFLRFLWPSVSPSSAQSRAQHSRRLLVARSWCPGAPLSPGPAGGPGLSHSLPSFCQHLASFSLSGGPWTCFKELPRLLLGSEMKPEPSQRAVAGQKKSH